MGQGRGPPVSSVPFSGFEIAGPPAVHDQKDLVLETGRAGGQMEKSRKFRSPESYEAEEITRDMLVDFLARRGFKHLEDVRERRGQTIVAKAPSGDRLTMRVRLCWRDGGPTRAASQIMTEVKDDDWEGSVSSKVERERSHGSTHFLVVQRADERITHAALILSPWCFRCGVPSATSASG